MKCLNEHIARRANEEDGCKGHFWEARFKSLALLDDVALITAMAYVDLNPIRAKIAKDIRTSEKTSVQQRYCEVTQSNLATTIPLMPFGEIASNMPLSGLPFNLQDYLELVDWTGRCIRPDKQGAIPDSMPNLLSQLGIEVGEWLPTVTELQARYELVMGSPHRMRQFAHSQNKLFHRGSSYARQFYGKTG